MGICKVCGCEQKKTRNNTCRYCATRVKNTKVWVCEECGVEFCLLHRIPKGRVKRFCGRRCQSNWLRRNPSLPKKEHRFKNRAMLIAAIKKVITQEGRYVPMDELCSRLHICAVEFKRLNVSVIGIHRSLGVKKPTSVAADIVFRALKKRIPDLTREVTFPDLVSPKGMVLRFDMGSEQHRLLLEIDGPQHHDKNHDWFTAYRESCDRMKDSYAEEAGYHLVRVQFTASYKINTHDLVQDILTIIGKASKFEDGDNQHPGRAGMPANGSETYRLARTAGTRILRNSQDNTACKAPALKV